MWNGRTVEWRAEASFEELAANVAAGRRLSPQEWTELYARHDQYEVHDVPPAK